MPEAAAPQAEFYTKEEAGRVAAHIARHFGPSDFTYHELDSPDIRVDIVIIPPREERGHYTLVTMGMGAHVMPVPDEARENGLTRAELLISLPSDWRLRDADAEDWPEDDYWPVRWLKTLARLPGRQDTWLGWGHTLSTGDTLPGTDFSCLLLLHPGHGGTKPSVCDMPDGSKVVFLQVVPLYEDEAEYKLDNGVEALLELLPAAALGVVDVSRPNVCADADPLKGIPFARRIDNFRAWFIANEPAIANGAHQAAKNPAASEVLTCLVSQGTALLAKNVFFIVGGREFTFATEGRACLFFLYPRLVAALRGGELGGWTFHPWLQGSGGKVFELDIFGVKLDTDSVLVGIEESGGAGNEAAMELRFFSPALAELDEIQAVKAFYVLLDNTVGEGIARRCVASVARAGEPEGGMAPLTQLEARLAARLQKAGGGEAAGAADPAGRFFLYTREVEEKEDGHDLRGDIFTGVTRYMPLVNDHHAASLEIWRAFAAFGAKPGFLYYYPDPEMDAKALLDQRYELQERIESEVLGTAEAGGELGLVMGGAVGQERVYIDLLLYDWDAARERLVRFVEGFPRVMFLSEFRPGGDVTMLFDSSTPDLFKKLTDLHDAGCCGETADVISAIPPTERGYDVQSLLGRALNNLDRHDEALEILESIRGQGEADPVWHFRVGYALYYLDREPEAAPHFQRAIDLGQDDERTREFLADCRAVCGGAETESED